MAPLADLLASALGQFAHALLDAGSNLVEVDGHRFVLSPFRAKRGQSFVAGYEQARADDVERWRWPIAVLAGLEQVPMALHLGKRGSGLA
ncbi:MAG: hypothetical protein K0S78_4858 [Thermomicrobiales bacterium]|jgi:hypothetical protein|nr:hypothetical protein [Thermomicrobiales bacterium]